MQEVPSPFVDKALEDLAFADSLESNDDRACALIACAYLDSQLEKLICSKLVGNNKTFDRLFGVSRPLSTFSARIDMAFLLGLICKEIHGDLHKLREIRNKFAHTFEPLDFASPTLKEHLSKLRSIYHLSESIGRKRFTDVCVAAMGAIQVQLKIVSQLKELPTLTEQQKTASRDELIKIIDDIAKNAEG